MPPKSESPIFNESLESRALKTALGSSAPLVISYGGNQEVLWALDNPGLKHILKSATDGLILIWDRKTPQFSYSGDISTAEFLNPLTWSLCVTRRFPKLKVAVLDCDVKTHASGKFYQVVEALNPDRLPFRLMRDAAGIVVEWESIRRERPLVRPAWGLLSQALRALLTERGQGSNHHSLANIVGPLILTGSGAPQRGHDALRLLFRQLGLIPPASSVVGNSQHASLFGGQRVRLLLVDDQANQGWSDWILKIVGPEAGCRLDVQEDPAGVVAAVESCLSGRDKGGDCRFRLNFPPLPPEQHPTQTLLLLDLRLFSLRSLTDEVRFVRTIIPLCRQFENHRHSRFAWPGFSPAELNAAADWCRKPVRETRKHYVVLSLLPRLLALADFSIPIVIFSSTGQRRIIELLKPYGNIITSFEKPRFSHDESGDLVVETEARFRDALSTAYGLLEARGKCIQILGDPGRLGNHLPKNGDSARAAKYVELFLDETEWDAKNLFSVGGCFSVFEGKDEADARQKADAFDRYLVGKGLRYFENRGVGVVAGSSPLDKFRSKDLSPKFENFRSLDCAPVHLGLARVRLKKGSVGPGELFDPSQADNRFLISLKALVELFLCESIPAIAGAGNPGGVVVSIFPGTRVVKIQNPERRSRAILRYGLKPAFKDCLFSIDTNAVYPLVADILSSHHILRKTFRLCAVQLPYFNADKIKLPEFFRCHGCDGTVVIRQNEAVGSPATWRRCCGAPDYQPDYRALHYFSDELLTEFPGDKPGGKYDAVFKPLRGPGNFDEILDSHHRATADAGRSLNLGDIVGAVKRFETPHSGNAIPRASHWLRERIAGWLPKIAGPEFVRLAAALAHPNAS